LGVLVAFGLVLVASIADAGIGTGWGYQPAPQARSRYATPPSYTIGSLSASDTASDTNLRDLDSEASRPKMMAKAPTSDQTAMHRSAIQDAMIGISFGASVAMVLGVWLAAFWFWRGAPVPKCLEWLAGPSDIGAAVAERLRANAPDHPAVLRSVASDGSPDLACEENQ